VETLRHQILQELRDTPGSFRNSRRWQATADRIFQFQSRHHPVYRRWVRFVDSEGGPTDPFPCLPLIAFKESVVGPRHASLHQPVFESSGTTRERPSRHHFLALDVYEASVIAGWRWFADRIGFTAQHPHFIALMPSSTTVPRSSLSRMLATLMRTFGDGRDFWSMRNGRWDWDGTARQLRVAHRQRQPLVVFGTAFAWVHFLDWCRRHHRRFHLPTGSIVLETGGYKGRSREVERKELHASLAGLLGVQPKRIFGEYSMCELSSQAYAASNGVFRFPPWCRHRVVHPLSTRPVKNGSEGILEILDLANTDSCAFLRTEDRAVRRGDGFELVGRLPRAGLKGCSLHFE
jgi:hypothetical protein